MLRTMLKVTLVCLVSFCSSCGKSDSTTGTSSEVGKLQVTKGHAMIARYTKRIQVSMGQKVAVRFGDTVYTFDGSEAVVLAARQVHVLAEHSRLTFYSPSPAGDGAGRVSLIEGVATFLLPPKPAEKAQFEAAANSVVAAVRGTIFRFESLSGETRVTVIRGQVEVRPEFDSPFAATLLREGERASVTAGKLATSALAAGELEKLRTEVLLKRQLLGIDISTF